MSDDFWQNWYEIQTNPNDPTNVTMRRLSKDEARTAHLENLKQWWEVEGQYIFGEPLQPIVDAFNDNVAKIMNDLEDGKEKDRQRVKDDVRRKHRERWSKRGRKQP